MSIKPFNSTLGQDEAPGLKAADIVTIFPHATGSSPTGTQSSPPSATSFHLFLAAVLKLVVGQGDGCDGVFVEIGDALYPLNSARFAEELILLYEEFTRNDPEAFLSDRDRKKAIAFLKAKAHRLADRREVFKHLAWIANEGAIYIDLRHSDGLCARIVAGSWDLFRPLKPPFVRHPTQRPLPVPVHSQDGHAVIARIMPTSLSTEYQKLLVGALLGCLIPSNFARSFSYPVMLLRGDAGSGKSTLSKLIKELIDNETAHVAAKPTKVDDLFVVGQGSHLLAFDNSDNVTGNISDAICQATTGSAVVKRKLYTDSDKTTLRMHGPFLLNGIGQLTQRQDLIDRSICIPLSRIDTFDPDAGSDAETVLPRVLGYLLDLMSRALANFESTNVEALPRLATVAKFVAAAEPFGCDTPFVTLLRRNQAELLTSSQENDPLIEALHGLMTATAQWTGTYKDLLAILKTKATPAAIKSTDWPKTERKLSAFITAHGPMLREYGISPAQGPKRNTGRLVTLTRTATFVDSSHDDVSRKDEAHDPHAE